VFALEFPELQNILTSRNDSSWSDDWGL